MGSTVYAEDGGSKKDCSSPKYDQLPTIPPSSSQVRLMKAEKLGYTVDTFMSDGDDVKMQNLMDQH